jgi:hypothetical protein
MTILKTLLLVGLFTLTNCATTNSQSSNNWTLIGEKVVDFAPDRDMMLVNSTLTFNKIKVRVLNGRVLMQNMKVEFGNGEVIDVSLKYVFNEGDYSRDIELPRGNRHISRITFVYKTARKSFDKAVVKVWGCR